MTIGPQPGTLRPCLILREFVPAGILWRLVLRVFPVPSGEPDRQLREACVERLRTACCAAARRRDHHLADDAPVPVALVPPDDDLFPEDEARHGLLRALAEGLGFFWGVYAGEANLVLRAVGIEDGDGVAVGNGDDGAGEGGGFGGEDGKHHHRAQQSFGRSVQRHSRHCPLFDRVAAITRLVPSSYNGLGNFVEAWH